MCHLLSRIWQGRPRRIHEDWEKEKGEKDEDELDDQGTKALTQIQARLSFIPGATQGPG